MNLKTVVSFRISESERDVLKNYAILKKSKPSKILRIALNDYINRNPNPDKKSTWSVR